MRIREGRTAALAALLALLVSGCASSPDLDAERPGAIPLELGARHRDSLDCAGEGDCRDWFRVAAPGEGTVQVEVARDAHAAAPDFVLEVADASGRVLRSVTSGGRDRLRVSVPIPAGPVHVVLSAIDLGSGLLEYELLVSFRPRPRTESRTEKGFDTVTSLVLEIENRSDGTRAVLIDKGRKAGISRGSFGRLVEAGREIAEIQILDVYDDGSRALIRGALEAPITPETVAEVRVPR